MILRGFIRRLFTKNTFASNVAKLASGSTIGQLSIILVSPLLTRLFIPEIFGSFQFILSSAAILAVIATLRYELALPLSKTPVQARNLFKLSVSLMLAVTTTVVLLLTFIPNLSIIHGKLTELGPLVYLIALVMLGEGMISIFNQWFSREERYAISGGGRSIFGISTALSQLIIGLTRMTTLLGLAGGYIVGQLFSVIFYLRNFLGSDLKEEQRDSESIIATAIEFRSFPLFSSWNTVLNTIARNLPVMLIGARFLDEQLGFFAIGLRALGFPLTTLGMSIGQVYYRQIAKYINNGLPILPFMLGTATRILLIMTLPMAIFYVWGEGIFSVVFGQNWAAAGVVVQVLAPFYLVRICVSPISTVFAAVQKQYYAAIWQLFYIAAVLIAFRASAGLDDFFVTMKYYSYAGVLVFSILFVLAILVANFHDRQLNRLDSQESQDGNISQNT